MAHESTSVPSWLGDKLRTCVRFKNCTNSCARQAKATLLLCAYGAKLDARHKISGFT